MDVAGGGKTTVHGTEVLGPVAGVDKIDVVGAREAPAPAQRVGAPDEPGGETGPTPGE